MHPFGCDRKKNNIKLMEMKEKREKLGEHTG